MAGLTKLQASCRLSAPAQAVWSLIEDFANPQAWVPGIQRVKLQGRVRTCQTSLGRFRERPVKWESKFKVGPGSDWCALTQQFARIYDAGLRSLQARYGSEDKDPLFRTKGANVSIEVLLKTIKGID